MRIAVCDVGLGNLRSVERGLLEACKQAGCRAQVEVTRDPARSPTADRLVMPGQGGFGDCARALSGGVGDAVRRHLAARAALPGHLPRLAGALRGRARRRRAAPGWGCSKGEVVKLRDGIDPVTGASLKIPHTGWNVAQPTAERGAFSRNEREHFYFVHSFVVVPRDAAVVAATTEYGAPLRERRSPTATSSRASFTPRRASGPGSRCSRGSSRRDRHPRDRSAGRQGRAPAPGPLRRRHRLRRGPARRARAPGAARFPWLHVVDLEGAREGRPVQRERVRAVVDAFGPGVEVGGGRADARELRGLPGPRRGARGPRLRGRQGLRRSCGPSAFEAPGRRRSRGRREGRFRRRRRVDAADARAGGRPGALVRRRAAARVCSTPTWRATARGPGPTSRPPQSSRRRPRCRSSRPAAWARSTTCAPWLRAASRRASSAAPSTTGPSRSTRPIDAAA